MPIPPVLGKYRIEREVGRGGFAVVYQAFDPSLGRRVAIKVPHPWLLTDPKFVERFRREARLAANLTHPHIVTIHEIGEEQGTPFIVMEWLEGMPLDQWLETAKPPPQGVLLALVGVGAALDYAHERGVVHRDIKPSNIMMTANRGGVLTDFGIAKLLAQATSTTSGVLGTPNFMAPEVLKGQPVTSAADIYALGVMLYQIMAGRLPFVGDTPNAVAYQHANEPPPDPQFFNAEVPRQTAVLLLQMLAKDPQERPAGAEKLIRTLLASLGAGAGAPQRIAPTPQRKPLWLLGSVMALVLIVVAFFAWALSGGGSPTASVTIEVEENAVGSNSIVAPTTSSDVVIAVATPTPPFTATPAPTATPTLIQQIAFHIEAVDPAWVRIIVDGEVQLEGILPVGSTYGFAAEREIQFRTGNAAGVRLTVNNQVLDALGREGDIIEASWTLSDGELMQLGLKTTTPNSGIPPETSPNHTPIPTGTPTSTSSPFLTLTPTPAPTSTVAVLPGNGRGRIVFSSWRDGNPELYTIAANGGNLRRLTNSPGDDWSPAWSRDGQQIAFTSSRDATPAGVHNIYVMTADGSNVRRLTYNQAWDEYADWSPDGSRIAFVTTADNNAEIFVAPALGGDAQRLTFTRWNERNPTWSPDGSLIAFSSDQMGVWQIYLMNADGSSPRQISFMAADSFKPVLSPDGRHIAFHSDQNGNRDIYVMNADGSDLRRLTTEPSKDEHPSWSPDGSAIVFSSNRGGYTDDLYVVWADGSQPTLLFASTADDVSPDWSP